MADELPTGGGGDYVAARTSFSWTEFEWCSVDFGLPEIFVKF